MTFRISVMYNGLSTDLCTDNTTINSTNFCDMFSNQTVCDAAHWPVMNKLNPDKTIDQTYKQFGSHKFYFTKIAFWDAAKETRPNVLILQNSCSKYAGFQVTFNIQFPDSYTDDKSK